MAVPVDVGILEVPESFLPGNNLESRFCQLFSYIRMEEPESEAV